MLCRWGSGGTWARVGSVRGRRPTSWSWMLLWPVCGILRGTPALGASAVSPLGTSLLLPGPFLYHDPRGVISVDLSSPAPGCVPSPVSPLLSVAASDLRSVPLAPGA